MNSSIISRNIVYLATIATLCFSSNSIAGVGTSLMQTAELQHVGEFEVLAQGDIIFNRGGGFNISGHARTGLIEKYMDIDVLVGSGKTNFQIGALTKYNLLPDVEGQMGLSFLGGASYLRDDVGNGTTGFTLVTLGAVLSKAIVSGNNIIVPYGSFQFEFLFGDGDTAYPMTLIAGSKWISKSVSPWVFYSEFGFKIKDAFYSFSVGAGYPF
ncbi:hypothetical protein GW915_10175 [bacterium]|nr:hypothetical protein [bacterium]